jgi:hypothetical protein
MAEKITKQEAVRRALAHFGREAKPAQMKGWIKEEFRIDMSTDHISTAKGEILRKAREGKKPAAKKPAPPKSAAREAGPKPTAPPQAKPTPAPATGGGGIPLEDILAVKNLVGRLGAGPLHALIDAFAE